MNLSRIPCPALAATALLGLLGATSASAQITRTPYLEPAGHNTAEVVSVDPFVFPSAAMGTRGTALEQVDAVVEQLNDALERRGLDIGNMIQHTVYLKDGAIAPGQVLQRFHADTTRIAPRLKDHPSVGTIVRVPAFANPDTLVAVDIVAADPGRGQTDTFVRVPFTFGPKEIAESITVDGLLFTAGTEAMDFEHGGFPKDIDSQIETIVGKMAASLKKSGLTLGDMLAHNLYVTKAVDPKHVIQKFHQELQKRSPELAKHPSTGMLAVVDGMAVDGFLLEVDAIFDAKHPAAEPDQFNRVPYTPPIDIVRSIDAGSLVFVSGLDGVSVPQPSKDAREQARQVAREIQSTLEKSGLAMSDIVKSKLYIRKDTDINQVQAAFHDAVVKLDPKAAENLFAETVIVVERLDSEPAKVEANVIAARSR